MRRLVLIVSVACLMIAATALGQADQQTGDDPCAGTMDPDVCFWSGMGGGGGGTGGGCQYCYWNSTAPYANCFTSSWSLPYPQYANCVGTQMCWTDGSGARYCEPWCQGSACYYV
jgi:hypothetical protein